MGSVNQVQVASVVQAMNELVARDGGAMVLDSYDDKSEIVTVVYREGVSDRCATCIVSAEMVSAFLLEGLRTREIPVSEVKVKEASPDVTPPGQDVLSS